MSGAQQLKGDRMAFRTERLHISLSWTFFFFFFKQTMLNKPKEWPGRNQRRQREIHFAFFLQFPSSTGETTCSSWKPRCSWCYFNNTLFGSYLTFLGEVEGNIFFSVTQILLIFWIQCMFGIKTLILTSKSNVFSLAKKWMIKKTLSLEEKS